MPELDQLASRPADGSDAASVRWCRLTRAALTALAWVLLMSIWAGPSSAQAVRSPRALDGLRLIDDPIRAFAVHTVTPEYPIAAMRRRETGVAVARVRVGSDGLVNSVDVLESPSDSISQAVRFALMKWTFKPNLQAQLGKPSAFSTSGTVTFYFSIEGTQFKVAGPLTAPNVRRRQVPR
jgi:TonB family protein